MSATRDKVCSLI